MIKICAISDLHGTLPEITEPSEIMLIAGDICPVWNHSRGYQKQWLEEEFVPWVNKLPIEIVFLIGGNHDFCLETYGKQSFWIDEVLRKPTNGKIVYLHHQAYDYITNDGLTLKLFGTPYCHQFGNWAFMKQDDVLVERFKNIPEEIDILISHDPAYCFGNTDAIIQRDGRHVGNVPLKERLLSMEKPPAIVVTGHIHSGDHNITQYKGIYCFNASILDETYSEEYVPKYFEYDIINKTVKKG